MNKLMAGATMEGRARPLPSLPLSLGNRKYTWAGRGSMCCVCSERSQVNHSTQLSLSCGGGGLCSATAAGWRVQLAPGGAAARGDFLIQ